jgi:hypothetical protein
MSVPVREKKKRNNMLVNNKMKKEYLITQINLSNANLYPILLPRWSTIFKLKTISPMLRLKIVWRIG